LHCAALGGHLEVVRLLLDNSADVNAKNFVSYSSCREFLPLRDIFKDSDLAEDMTALHIAASFGYKDIVELLIARGADLDAKTAVSKKKLFDVQSWRLMSIF
jgi:ankyrin repeat protein